MEKKNIHNHVSDQKTSNYDRLDKVNHPIEQQQ